MAPTMFGQKEIGESYLPSADKAVGRTMLVNLKDLTGNVKDQNAHISLRITKADGSTLQTNTIGYKLSGNYLKRMVRKNASKIDDYVELTTKTNQKVILKSITVTRRKVQRSVQTEIRSQLAALLKEEFSKSTFEAVLPQIVNRKLQFSLKKKLSKVYPIKEVAVRMVILVDRKANVEEKPVVVEELVAEDAGSPVESAIEAEQPAPEEPEKAEA
ncbi:hypothetical protein CL620_05680 [archaeon]|nr:hypothetical protein [archaeon]